jgi:hypothetical protein
MVFARFLRYLLRTLFLTVAVVLGPLISVERGRAAEKLTWEPVEGNWREMVTEDGKTILAGSGGVNPELGKFIHPQLQFTNIPDGEFAIEIETRANGCYLGNSFLIRGKSLGEGMILMFHGNNGWRAFRNNLAPGHVDQGSLHPDNQTHHNFSTTLYDTHTVTATLYEDYPDQLDPVHPHDKKEEWWTVKIQVWDNRLMTKAWLSGQPEPEAWAMDFPVELDQDGPVGLLVNDPARLRNIQRVPVEPGRFRLIDRDHRETRFGPPLEDYLTTVELKEDTDLVTIGAELVELTFRRDRCAIAEARLRDEHFPVSCLPDLLLVDAAGTEFRQRYAKDGNLQRMRSADDRWIKLGGQCTPRTARGVPMPFPFRFQYRIHRQSGLIHFRATPLAGAGRPVELRKLAFVHELADQPHQGMNDYQWVSDRHNFGLGNRALRSESRDDGVAVSERLAIGTWGNGRYAFQVTPISYHQCRLDDALLEEDQAYRYLALGTRNGHRTVDLVFVNRMTGSPVALDEAGYESTFSFLPWRRYRPRMELFCSSRICGDALISSVDYEQEMLRRVAQMGATLHCHGYPPMGLLAPALDQARVGRQVREAHYFGLKDKVSWVLGNNWIGAWGTPSTAPFDLGWLTKEEAFRARRLAPLKPGKTRGEDPPVPRELCVNDPVTRELFIDRITMPVMDAFESSSVYWDWTWPINYCANADHGDAGVSLTPLGHVALIDRFREASRQRAYRPAVMGCTYDAHCTPVSLLDMFNPGEAGKGWWVPNQAEHNLIYSSLLYGTQCIYHTYGGIANDTPRVYEQALAHCSTVGVHYDVADPPNDDPPGTPGGTNKFERELWVRYMTPLAIFDVNRAGYRHPYDQDYEQFCASSDGVTAIPYFRDGRVLLVVVKNSSNVRTGDVTLKTGPLGLGQGNMLVMDVIGKGAEVKQTAAGQLDFSGIQLAKGPRMFLVQELPAEPTVIWHSPATWQSRLSGAAAEQQLVMNGVPESELQCTLWCAAAGPPTIKTGGVLIGYDQESRLATVRGHADVNSRAVVELVW